MGSVKLRCTPHVDEFGMGSVKLRCSPHVDEFGMGSIKLRCTPHVDEFGMSAPHCPKRHVEANRRSRRQTAVPVLARTADWGSGWQAERLRK